MKIQTLMTALVLAASGAAFAQTTAGPAAADLKAVAPAAEVKSPVATPAVDKAQAEQQLSIEKGVASGQLSTKEATDLEKSETKLEANKKGAKADGKVTAQEKKKLKVEASANAKAINKQKADKPVLDPVK
ncbi:hypothetical protein [Rhodoferax ferrireducens]|uniref:hypothetical protein n=1 Tax=Rhodoferax ferrireducens TaxID=192843 RepID=UPI000E0DB13E|nr:hypothetical protein [Rhodoferax ferrireducens]